MQNVSYKTSTQKAEAFNRIVVFTVKKETNFLRNFRARLATHVHKSNNIISTSVKRKKKSIIFRNRIFQKQALIIWIKSLKAERQSGSHAVWASSAVTGFEGARLYESR